MRIRERLRQVLAVKESPHRIAVAFSLGIFIGMSPLLGLHTVLGLALAWVLKLNRLVTLVGVFITNPWTIVPIYTFGTWVGAKIMGLRDIMPDVDWAHIGLAGFISEFRHLLAPFVLGSTIIGLISAAIGYVVIYRAVKRARG